MEKTGCKIICGAPTTLAVKGSMMMLMMMMIMSIGNTDVDFSYLVKNLLSVTLDSSLSMHQGDKYLHSSIH